jgi:hypothetical protein
MVYLAIVSKWQVIKHQIMVCLATVSKWQVMQRQMDVWNMTVKLGYLRKEHPMTGSNTYGIW